MERLYTPWRMKYVTSAQKKIEGCVFCAKIEDDTSSDRENLVLFRGPTTFTVMNLYPYNTGHLMILPYEHVATLSDVTIDARLEIMNSTAYFVEVLTKMMKPDGFNIGINLGKVAGAGIAGHLHQHIVPRWGGDSNFMAVVGETRILPEELWDTYDRIIKFVNETPPQFS